MSFIRSMAAMLVVLISIAPAGAADKKLDYKQVQAVKDIKYYMDQVEGLLDAIDEASAKWKPGDATIPITKVQGAIDAKDKAATYLKNANTRLAQLPATHGEVAPWVAKSTAAAARIAGQEKRLSEIHKGLMDVVKTGATAEYKIDFDRLGEINRLFSDPQIITSQPERGIEAIKLMSPTSEERQRIAKKYEALLNQPTGEAKQMRETLAYFDVVFPKFSAAAKSYAADAPGEIDKQLAETMTMTQDAQANKKHLFFGPGGGIEQRLNQAQGTFDTLAAIAPTGESTAQSKQKIADARLKVKAAAATLSESIIEGNRVPESRYAGKDLEQLAQIVKDKWTNEGGGAAVMKHGINSADWKRDTQWVWDSTAKAFYKVDKSRAQGWVLIKTSETMAAVYHINLVKDHLANDSIKAYFFDEPKGEISVLRQVMLKNVK